MKILLSLYLLLFTQALWAQPVLEIESHPVVEAIIKETGTLGSVPEIYNLSEKYRLDLTISDLVDQAAVIAEEYPGLNERLKAAFQNYNFDSWMRELKKAATENGKLKQRLNKELYAQFYSPKGVALLPEYTYIDLQKIKDNGKLVRIGKYNKFTDDPEAQGLLAAFAELHWSPFYTKNLTVAKLKSLKYKQLGKIHKVYYKLIIERYVKLDPVSIYRVKKNGLHASSNESVDRKSMRLFNILQKLPNKHQVFFALLQEVPTIPTVDGMLILTPRFIQENFETIEESLREMTLSQYLRSEDDRYLLALRNYIKAKASIIEVDLAEYNRREQTNAVLEWKDRSKKPRRPEAISNLEIMLTLYPKAPWDSEIHGTVIDRKGKEVFFQNRFASFFKRFTREMLQTETYVSLLAGTVTLILTEGNVPVAMSTRKLVKKAIATHRYDKEWDDFIKEAPMDVLDAILLGSGAGAGRLFKIIALGAGQGFLQSLFTGQDLRTGAAVGAGLNLIQFYLLPTGIARPMQSGFDAKALAANRRLELLEKAVRGSIQGATVAAIDGQDILKSAIKGSVYGLVSTQLVIWFVGTRYNPFKDYGETEIDEMIALENKFQNLVGRGGTYNIDRQLILDANFRVGGVLPKLISASITLPGNVAMSKNGFNELMTVTHEGQHLMQQHQSGVFGFYLFRYLPTSLVSGYWSHPDENFLEDFLGMF